MRSSVLVALLLLILLVVSGCDAGAPTPTATTLQATPAASDQSSPTSEPEPPIEETPTSPLAELEPESTSPPAEVQPVPTPTRLTSDASITIVTLGDSLTEGDADDSSEGGGYPRRLGEMANRVRPGTQVVNMGKSGWDSGQLVSDQLPGALAANPQVALVWIGSNDLWYNNAPSDEEWTQEYYTTNIDTILRTLTEAGVRVYIALLDDQSKRPVATNPELGYSYSDAERAMMSKRAVNYNDIITDKAAEYGATTVDFYNTTIFTDPATLAEDGIHPNGRGYDIIAEMWFQAIESYLAP